MDSKDISGSHPQYGDSSAGGGGAYSKRKYFNESSPNIFHSNSTIGGGLAGGFGNGIETDENGNITFNPQKFLAGFIGGAVATKGASVALKKLPKVATMLRMKAKNDNPKLYETLHKIESSNVRGAKMQLIGAENLSEEVLAYIVANDKRVAINKLDSTLATKLGYKHPHDVRRTIQRDDIIHALQRHGADSNLARESKQRAVTLKDIANYQKYADSAEVKGLNNDANNNRVLVSVNQISDEFYVVVEQIRKKHNELSFKTMFFERGKINDKTLKRLMKERMPNT